MVVYLGRCPRLYTAALAARVGHTGVFLAISPGLKGVLAARVAHTGLRIVITVLIPAISPGWTDILAARATLSGLRRIILVAITVIINVPAAFTSTQAAPFTFYSFTFLRGDRPIHFPEPSLARREPSLES